MMPTEKPMASDVRVPTTSWSEDVLALAVRPEPVIE